MNNSDVQLFVFRPFILIYICVTTCINSDKKNKRAYIVMKKKLSIMIDSLTTMGKTVSHEMGKQGGWWSSSKTY